MAKPLKKLSFALKLSVYPFRNFIKKCGINYDIVELINNYYKEDFKKILPKYKAVILPHCVIAKNCPAGFSKEDGIMCRQCSLCKCGEIKRLAEKKGLQFYITPSVGFTKRLAARKGIKAAIGSTCIYEVEKGMKQEKISPNGLFLSKNKIIPLVILTKEYDCIVNEIDWNALKKMIELN